MSNTHTDRHEHQIKSNDPGAFFYSMFNENVKLKVWSDCGNDNNNNIGKKAKKMSSSKKIDCIDNWFDAENQLKIYFLYSNDPFKNEKKWKKWIAIIIIPSGYIFYMVDTIDYHQRQQQNSIQKKWMNVETMIQRKNMMMMMVNSIQTS